MKLDGTRFWMKKDENKKHYKEFQKTFKKRLIQEIFKTLEFLESMPWKVSTIYVS